MSKISFICPVFNKKKYLSRVLNSIKNQKGSFEKEYIFINDGSRDGSLEYIKKTTSKWKNTLILSQSNKGPAKATQLGIKHSQGDFIKLVGGDDVMSPNCSELLLQAIQKTNSVATFSNYKLIDNYEKIKFKKTPIQNVRVIEKPMQNTIKSSFSGTTPNLYCNRTIKKSGGCNEKIFIEDFSLVLGLSKYGSFSFIDNLTCYGPKNDKKRIMEGKKTQLIHDYNAALYYFFKENNDIDTSIIKIACKKSLGRTDKWYRRELGRTIFNKMVLYKISLLLGRNDYLDLIKQSCIFFYEKISRNCIRYKIL
jgi:glycosyltransferase involved in cell wall biosynthesis